GSISIDIPPESLPEAQQLLIAGMQPKVELKPILEKHFLTLPRGSLTDFRSDLERITDALKLSTKIRQLRPAYVALTELPEALRKGEWAVTVTLTHDGLVTWVDAGRTEDRLFGFALDVGTTKLAGYLVDLRSGAVLGKASMLNPQIPHGEDVISRIAYASKGHEQLVDLQLQVIHATNSLIHQCCAQAAVEPEEIFHIVVVGNTAMHHLFLGISPKYVALAPYPAVLRSAFRTYASEVGVAANPGCLLSALPCVAGFVGADAIADILATRVYESKSLVLLVDIGTNTEIILGDRNRLVSCSSPSGPAFEGAHIENGMRAEMGAIERIWIDNDSLEPEYTTIGDEKPRGLCGSAVVDAMASMRRVGLLNVEGRMIEKNNSKRIRSRNGSKEYVIAWKEETQTGRDIVITQHDVEEIKLAKAAVHSGITVLAKLLDVQVTTVSGMFVAGAFGTYLDPHNARTLGMYPNIPLDRISFVGNTAGSGARMALISKEEYGKAQKLAETLEYVELAANPQFQREFIDSLYIPHKAALKETGNEHWT
ncbi:MAG TPA: ASKHA domain-containing protein, partial [Candidatus Acidoferrales bacterium]|nr:ASKHA domain-containing protein [Candidatus Acidoferrales bacterium]